MHADRSKAEELKAKEDASAALKKAQNSEKMIIWLNKQLTSIHMKSSTTGNHPALNPNPKCPRPQQPTSAITLKPFRSNEVKTTSSKDAPYTENHNAKPGCQGGGVTSNLPPNTPGAHMSGGGSTTTARPHGPGAATGHFNFNSHSSTPTRSLSMPRPSSSSDMAALDHPGLKTRPMRRTH